MPHDKATGWIEPDITINGVVLSFGQAMALRVAASTFLMEMSQPDPLGNDGAGRGIANGYRERMTEVCALMIQPKNGN